MDHFYRRRNEPQKKGKLNSKDTKLVAAMTFTNLTEQCRLYDRNWMDKII